MQAKKEHVTFTADPKHAAEIDWYAKRYNVSRSKMMRAFVEAGVRLFEQVTTENRQFVEGVDYLLAVREMQGHLPFEDIEESGIRELAKAITSLNNEINNGTRE